jgi:hypothetical protein
MALAVVSRCRRSLALAVGLASVVGCAASAAGTPAAVSSAPESPAFGGERAQFGASASGRVVDERVGRCQDVPADGRDPLLADFEQDSIFLRPVPERYGVWYMSNDGSPGGEQSPASYAAERGGPAGSNYAVHFRVQGFSEWGAVVGFLLRHAPEEGIKCPFNAEAFEGISFLARGSGRIRVNLATPETTPTEQEGRCQRGCWDNHGAFVFLNEQWTEHRLPWSAFAQQGWGAATRLNVRELLAVNFSVLREDQPVELWLDDVAFSSGQAR